VMARVRAGSGCCLPMLHMAWEERGDGAPSA
jgi:hypothetical protein